MSNSSHRFVTVIVGVPLFLTMVVMLSQRPATSLLILMICVPMAIRRRGRAMARKLIPEPRRASAVWRVLGTVFVVAGVAAGATWYVMRWPLTPWMVATYFVWGVIAYLILDHAIDHRFRSGWLRNVVRMLLVACFAWTLVAPWRLLGRLSDWYFERHPLITPPVAWPAAEDDDARSLFDYDHEYRYSPAFSHLSHNIHNEDHLH